jgi:regulatory protein
MSGKHTITALKWLPSQPDRVMVHLDGAPAGSVDLVTAGQLKVGDCLEAARAQELQAGHHRREAYQRALRLLGVRDHSALEIRQKLARQDFDGAAVELAIEKLITNKYIDDQTFAINWINFRRRSSPRSRRLLAQELKLKGIAADQIDAALAHADEPDMARACLHRKRRRWRRFDDRTRRLKMLAHLSNKGFSYDVSRAAIESYHDETD